MSYLPHFFYSFLNFEKRGIAFDAFYRVESFSVTQQVCKSWMGLKIHSLKKLKFFPWVSDMQKGSFIKIDGFQKKEFQLVPKMMKHFAL